MKRCGFTGTQNGMTLPQRHEFARYILRLRPDEFHHGLCVGADEQAHEIVRVLMPDCRIVGHPGRELGEAKRSIVVCDELRPIPVSRTPELDRNDNIAALDWLIAAPGETSEQIRSGTWATVRRARRRDTPTFFLWP